MIEKTRKKARDVFDMWFPVFGKKDEEGLRERLFEYFHSGYIAGTRFSGEERTQGKGCPPSIVKDDTERNLDL